jgi:F-type H+-transporting ATPase subunit b
MPEGHPIIKPTHNPAPGAQPAHHEEAGEEACHSPNAPTHPVNWYQGLLKVDNKRANGAWWEKLLFRYQNPKDECDPRNQEPPVLASFINLAIVAYILYRAGKKPIAEALQKRKKTIMQDIDAATSMKLEAEKRLKGYESQLARIEEKKRELREEYRAQWEAERARILKEAEEKALRLRRDAEFRIAQERKQAQADVLRDAVDGAVAAAEELVRSRIQATDQERLADDYLSGIGVALKQSDRRVS